MRESGADDFNPQRSSFIFLIYGTEFTFSSIIFLIRSVFLKNIIFKAILMLPNWQYKWTELL